MRHHLIQRECTASQSSQPHRPPSPTCALPHSQTTGLPGSRNSLGTVLSETVAMVSLSASPTVACSEQLEHSKTAGTIRSGRGDIHLFPVNNPSLDTDQYSPPPLAPRWRVKKTPPTTELQIHATITTLIANKFNIILHKFNIYKFPLYSYWL